MKHLKTNKHLKSITSDGMDHSFHTGTIKTVPQKNFVPIFTQELFRVTIYERVTFLQNIVCLFSHRNYKNSSSEI